jgi:hypothetical protein
MFGSNSVACCFSALFIILVGFAAVATVCDQTWSSVDQTLSRCLTVCCRWPVALCLLRFEENCVNNLLYSSSRIHIYPAISTSKFCTSVHIPITYGSWLIYNTHTHTNCPPLIYCKLQTNINNIIHNVSTATCFNTSALSYTSVVLNL